MVDRIAPATAAADLADGRARLWLSRRRASVVGEPFRQWVIERRFAGPHAALGPGRRDCSSTTSPRSSILKMRVLNARADDACLPRRSWLGHDLHLRSRGRSAARRLRAAHAGRGDARRRWPPFPASTRTPMSSKVSPGCSNTAIRHRNHQIATDGSQKIVQRLLNPLRERLRRGQASAAPAGRGRRLDRLPGSGRDRASARAGRPTTRSPNGSPRSPIATGGGTAGL